MPESTHGAGPSNMADNPQAAFQVVVAHHGGQMREAGGRGFGSDALKIGGRIFASLSHDRLLLKLPAKRADALIESGIGERFSTGAGRPKRDWVTIAPTSAAHWIELSEEARRFVGAEKTTGRG
jgi:hypothetical protein